MTSTTPFDATGFGDDDDQPPHYKLKLFVIGASPNSVKAIANLKAICDKHLPDRYTLDVIDVHQQAPLAEQEQLIALPLLVKLEPLPVRRLIGDMSDVQKVLRGLGIGN